MDDTRISAWTRVVLLFNAQRHELAIYELDDENLDQLIDAATAVRTDRIVLRDGLDGEAATDVAA